ncbi:hypothetical protein B0H19DRAFT_969598, partial [Mycena capillaripes]
MFQREVSLSGLNGLSPSLPRYIAFSTVLLPASLSRLSHHLNRLEPKIPIVLLCLIDKAQDLNKPLYVAYLDLKNAFPGTDRSTLWVKLAKLGIPGPMIE